LDFADRAHLHRPIGAIHRAALLEDSANDVVAGIEIGEQFGQQIGPAAAVPQMMMRIDDWQGRFEDLLFLLFCKPRLVGLAAMTKPAWLNGLRHGKFPFFADIARILGAVMVIVSLLLSASKLSLALSPSDLSEPVLGYGQRSLNSCLTLPPP